MIQDTLKTRNAHEEELIGLIHETVAAAFDAQEPSEEEQHRQKRKKIVATASKGVTLLVGVALSAYMALQEAVSERPTRTEMRGHVTESVQRVASEVEAIKDHVRDLEAGNNDTVINITKLQTQLESFQGSINEGFKDIKEELKYLRRNGTRGSR